MRKLLVLMVLAAGCSTGRFAWRSPDRSKTARDLQRDSYECKAATRVVGMDRFGNSRADNDDEMLAECMAVRGWRKYWVTEDSRPSTENPTQAVTGL